MHLISEFDELNVESFIDHIQIAVKRLAVNQYELLLCSVIAQKVTGTAKRTIRIDATPNFPQLYEKLRINFSTEKLKFFLHWKFKEIRACIQRLNDG